MPYGTRLAPPRPGVRHVHVFRWRTIIAGDRLRKRVDRLFHWPIIALAMAILPLLVIELIWMPAGWLRTVVAVAFGIVWAAFVVEFVVKFTIAESRLEYARRNWLDLVIIAVPVLGPLRLKASVTRTARVFKLRGVGMKFARYAFTVIIGMEATERLLERVGIKQRQGDKDPLRMTRHELMTEVRRRRRLLAQWERWYDAQVAYLREQGNVMDPTPPPADVEPDPQHDDAAHGAPAPEDPAPVSDNLRVQPE